MGGGGVLKEPWRVYNQVASKGHLRNWESVALCIDGANTKKSLTRQFLWDWVERLEANRDNSYGVGWKDWKQIETILMGLDGKIGSKSGQFLLAEWEDWKQIGTYKQFATQIILPMVYRCTRHNPRKT